MKSYNDFQFSIATHEDNKALVHHVKNNPIQMDLEYHKDKKDNFFLIPDFLKHSKVIVAKNFVTKEIVACVTFLQFTGQIDNEQISFQYITDLIKDKSRVKDPLLMKELLNFGLRNHFNSDFIIGLINENNHRARIFSKSDKLIYRSKVVAKMNYYELLPLNKYRIPKKYKFQTPQNNNDLQKALDFINEHYKNHLLFRPLDIKYFESMIQSLPDFSLNNITILNEDDKLKGVAITYNPINMVSLSITHMDFKSKIISNAIRVINKFTGLLFSPPKEGEPINTLNVRFLAGGIVERNILLRCVNNYANRNNIHTISMLLDSRESINIPNKLSYEFKSLIYSAFKEPFASKITLFEKHPVFFDISFS